MDNTISSSVYQSQQALAVTTDISLGTPDLSSTPTPHRIPRDKVSLSSESLAKNNENTDKNEANEKGLREEYSKSENSSSDVQETQKLQKRDAEVRAHEQAHLSNAGQYAAGGASFSYETGPNGKRYAVGGEVPIDLSKEKDPQATLAKMTQVRRAALAPASPSAADRNIAARASMIAAEAMSEINSSASKDINSNSPSHSASNDESDDQNSDATSSTQKQSFPNSYDSIPTHTRHMVLQAYTAQS